MSDYDQQLERAAELIRAGRLVAFPTETVYGLGANALDAQAVARIFEVKGRPRTVPLIVHVTSIEMARELVASWPPAAEILARRFWPGPLTLVLPRSERVPDVVTAGLGTVGLRVPAHPTALELIRRAGCPIAAPSANRFNQLSPTTAAHVHQGLGNAVDLILDGGSSEVGLESTVLSLSKSRPVLLRPGMVLREEIERLIGPIEVTGAAGEGAHASPGLHPRHYSPATQLILVTRGCVPADGKGAYVGFLEQPSHPVIETVRMPLEPEPYAALLYETLHRLDAQDLDWIAVERPPQGAAWAAPWDRLQRAAAK